MHVPLCSIVHPNSVTTARCGALIRAKSNMLRERTDEKEMRIWKDR
ncbi:DUF6783 domain-containing protein [Blautia sp. Sow4_E7]